MAYTLNTGHALYSNLLELIGVQSGTLVSHKTARTFTNHAESSFGNGPLGEHFRSVGGGFTVKGSGFTPSVSLSTVANPDITLVIVVNKIAAAGGGGKRNLVGTQTTGAGSSAIGLNSSGMATTLENWNTLKATGTTDLDAVTTQHMLAVVKIGETAHKLYVDGAFEVDSATRLSYNTANAFWDYIGGATGQGSVAADFVWLAWFNKALSEAELDEIYSSLGANNAISLIASSNGTATISSSNNPVVGSVVSEGNSKTNLSATLANTVSAANSSGGAGGSVLNAQGDNVVGSVTTVSSTQGTFVSEALSDNAGNLLSNITLSYVALYNDTTGALVVRKTSVATNGSGVFSFTDPAIVAGVTYRVDWEDANGRRRMPRKVAS